LKDTLAESVSPESLESYSLAAEAVDSKIPRLKHFLRLLVSQRQSALSFGEQLDYFGEEMSHGI
jgi:hypothetical protein